MRSKSLPFSIAQIEPLFNTILCTAHCRDFQKWRSLLESNKYVLQWGQNFIRDHRFNFFILVHVPRWNRSSRVFHEYELNARDCGNSRNLEWKPISTPNYCNVEEKTSRRSKALLFKRFFNTDLEPSAWLNLLPSSSFKTLPPN